jgi:outer membrane receptor protein involved in Fe transport
MEEAMLNRYIGILLAILVPVLLFAQDGKVRGRVVDKETGEPLVGASVLLDGTTLGASSDVNGDYIILAVPPVVYTVKVNYVGYAPYSISNIRVSSGQTTTLDVKLTSSAIQVGEIQVIAERPIIQRNTTNTIRTTTQEDIQNLPVRGVGAVVALQAGVTTQAGRFYIRGGRSSETAYYVDGAPVTNPLTSTSYVSVVPEAVEEVQVQSGGFSAEFGGANSGIVSTNMRTGTADYRASVSFETDDLAKPGKEFLGTTGAGYRNAVVTLSGPIPSVEALRFYALYQNNYQRDRSYGWVTPFTFNLVGDNSDPQPGRALPGPFAMKENFIPKNWYTANTFQGNLVYDAKSFKVRFTGSYEQDKLPSDVQLVPDVTNYTARPFPNALFNYYRTNRLMETTQKYALFNLKVTHVLDAETYYELSGSYQLNDTKRQDPNFGDNWMSYTDSTANAALGYTGWTDRWNGPPEYKVINGFEIANEFAPNVSYNKQRQVSWGGGAEIVHQVSKYWELKGGGRFDRWTMRNFTVNSINGLNGFLYGQHGEHVAPTFTSAAQRTAVLAKAGGINNYGYDVDGNEVSDGPDAPFHPTFLSAYVQNKFEYQDFVFNAGLRFEHFQPGSKTFPNPSDPYSAYNDTLDVIDQSKLVDAPTYNYVLPRLSFSFPVSVGTVFYAQYGKYVQMPSLNLLYVGNTTISRTVSTTTRGNAYLTPVGFLMTPERSTQYEMGIRQMLSENFSFTLTGFYKDARDQAQQRNYVTPDGVSLYRSYQNVDFGTVKGIELTLELRRTKRFAARVNYTLSDAQGTGSNPNGAAGIIEQGIGRQINFINPLGYNQKHRGTVMFDYRWNENEGGPILSGLGGNLLFTFNSGHSYTKIKSLQSLGQSNSWTVGTYPQTDPRYSYPTEPINSSSTPFFLNIDLAISKLFAIGSVKTEVFIHITNLLNTKQVLNVYPTTGESDNDGWLTNPLAANYLNIPQYADFYRAINLENRWSWAGLPERGQSLGAATNSTNDIYGVPRQIRIGARVEI